MKKINVKFSINDKAFLNANKIKPIKYVLIFNIFTVMMFITAPFETSYANLFLFLLLIGFSYFFLYIGFNIGFNKKNVLSKKKYNIKHIISFVFIFNIVTILIKYSYLLKTSPFDIGGMINVIMIGIYSPELGYKRTLDKNLIQYIPWSIYFITSIVNQLFLFFGLALWKRLSKMYKFLYVLFFILEILVWMGKGTNFGVITLILLLFFNLVFFQNSKKIKQISFIVFPFLAIFSFISLMTSRRNNAEFDINAVNYTNAVIDYDSFIFRVLPSSLLETYMYVLNYLTQGYYHTLIAFDLDFKFTYFFGNNPNIMQFGEFLLGTDIYKNTYVYRMKDYGVDPEVNWHSAYTWIASDTTFYLLPFFFLFIGYLYGISWKLSLVYNDLLSKVVFLVFSIFLIFLFANNNFISSILYSWFFLLPYWYFTRIYKKELIEV